MDEFEESTLSMDPPDWLMELLQDPGEPGFDQDDDVNPTLGFV